MKKWLICGGRNAPAAASHYVNDVLDRLIILQGRPAAICEGEATGYDHLAKSWAKERRVTCVPFPADWKKHGHGAGPARNKQMLDQFKPDFIVAFPGGDGTDNMIAQAKKAGVNIIRVPPPDQLGYRFSRDLK